MITKKMDMQENWSLKAIFNELSEKYGYEEHDLSGKSTLQTPPYTESAYKEATDPSFSVPRARQYAGAKNSDVKQR